MKKPPLFISAMLVSGIAAAQLEKPGQPFHKEFQDSLFRSAPKSKQPFVFPLPKQYNFPETKIARSFEQLNPGATVINRTSRGTIYNMPLDNMPVLVPDMKTAEQMPVDKSQNQYNMPNPFYRQQVRPKKK